MVALEDLDLLGKGKSVGFFFLRLFVDAGGKISLDSLALDDFILFDPNASSSSFRLHFNGTSSHLSHLVYF